VRISVPGRCALTSCVAAAMLAGCGGSQPAIRAPGATTRVLPATYADRGKLWSRTSSGDLIYVAADGESYVLTYPQGKLVGTIDHGAADACSDRAGNVFLTVDQGVDEFSHGATTPSATLSVPGTSWGCAVDPLSGNLAVTFFGKSGDDVAVFADAQGQPTLYNSGFGPWGESASYDNAGNLFVDGVSESGIGLAELPQGGGSFSSISISPPIATHVGRLQWDGTYLTLESGVGLQRQPNLLTINRLSISDSIATVVSTTTFKNISETLCGRGYMTTQSSFRTAGAVVTSPIGSIPMAASLQRHSRLRPEKPRSSAR
jgi:hypothetical protein